MDLDGQNDFNFDLGMDVDVGYEGGLPLMDNIPTLSPDSLQHRRKLKVWSLCYGLAVVL
jgi:hypothetical protein